MSTKMVRSSGRRAPAAKKKGGAGASAHARKADNGGYVLQAHAAPSKDEKGYPAMAQPTESVHSSFDDMAAAMRSHFGEGKPADNAEEEAAEQK